MSGSDGGENDGFNALHYEGENSSITTMSPPRFCASASSPYRCVCAWGACLIGSPLTYDPRSMDQ